MDDVAIVILAAGKGSRMGSDVPKVLHTVAGKSMVLHVLECAVAIARDHIHVVVGHQAEAVRAEVEKHLSVCFAVQQQLLGTGDAVKAALPGIASGIQTILVVCGDVPLIQKQTLEALLNAHKKSGGRFECIGCGKNRSPWLRPHHHR